MASQTVFWRNAIEIGEIAALANQQPQVCPLSGEFASHMMAYEAGRACDKISRNALANHWLPAPVVGSFTTSSTFAPSG